MLNTAQNEYQILCFCILIYVWSLINGDAITRINSDTTLHVCVSGWHTTDQAYFILLLHFHNSSYLQIQLFVFYFVDFSIFAQNWLDLWMKHPPYEPHVQRCEDVCAPFSSSPTSSEGGGKVAGDGRFFTWRQMQAEEAVSSVGSLTNSGSTSPLLFIIHPASELAAIIHTSEDLLCYKRMQILPFMYVFPS